MRKLVWATLFLAIIGFASAIPILVQTFPPVPTQAQVVTSSCSTTSLFPSNGPFIVGTSGSVRFKCSATAPAFNTVSGTATPTFTLPAGYTSLSYIADITTQCAQIPGQDLVTGIAETFTPGGWDYCAVYAVAPSPQFAGFTVTWDQ